MHRKHLVALSDDGTHVTFGWFLGTITSPGAAHREQSTLSGRNDAEWRRLTPFLQAPRFSTACRIALEVFQAVIGQRGTSSGCGNLAYDVNRCGHVVGTPPDSGCGTCAEPSSRSHQSQFARNSTGFLILSALVAARMRRISATAHRWRNAVEGPGSIRRAHAQR